MKIWKCNQDFIFCIDCIISVKLIWVVIWVVFWCYNTWKVIVYLGSKLKTKNMKTFSIFQLYFSCWKPLNILIAKHQVCSIHLHFIIIYQTFQFLELCIYLIWQILLHTIQWTKYMIIFMVWPRSILNSVSGLVGLLVSTQISKQASIRSRPD